MTNLVENASRFIEPDGHITIELFGLKGNSILAVKDDGTGFGDIDPSCCSTASTAPMRHEAEARAARGWGWPS